MRKENKCEDLTNFEYKETKPQLSLAHERCALKPCTAEAASHQSSKAAMSKFMHLGQLWGQTRAIRNTERTKRVCEPDEWLGKQSPLCTSIPMGMKRRLRILDSALVVTDQID